MEYPEELKIFLKNVYQNPDEYHTHNLTNKSAIEDKS